MRRTAKLLREEKKYKKTKEVKKIATKKNFQDKVFRVFHLNSQTSQRKRNTNTTDKKSDKECLSARVRDVTVAVKHHAKTKESSV